MKFILLFTLIFSSAALAKNTVKDAPFYGEQIKTNKAKAIPLDLVIKNFSKYSGSEVVMEANVEKVCAKKGCWMTLQGSNETFRVKFKDYSFFVPMSLIGKKVLVKGKVLRKEVSVAHTKHYLEDAGADKDKIAAVKKPTVEYRIMASGVRAL